MPKQWKLRASPDRTLRNFSDCWVNIVNSSFQHVDESLGISEMGFEFWRKSLVKYILCRPTRVQLPHGDSRVLLATLRLSHYCDEKIPAQNFRVALQKSIQPV
jgi:hypothetical protein